MAYVGSNFDSVVRIGGGQLDDLVFYDRGSGKARFFHADGRGNLERYRQVNIGQGWTHVGSGSFGGRKERDMICFDNRSGRARLVLDQGNDDPAFYPFDVPREEGSTVIVGRFGSPASAYHELLFYNRQTGRASLFLSDGRANFRPAPGSFEWGPGWQRVTSGSFVSSGAVSDVFLYRAGSGAGGEARLVTADGSARVFTEPGAPIGLDAWSHVVRSNFGPGAFSDLLFYSSRTGVARFYGSDGRGRFTPRVEHPPYGLSPDYSHVVAARLSSSRYSDFLLYRRDTGIVEVWSVIEAGITRLQARPYVKLIVRPNRIEPGGQATLEWTTREASTVDLQNFPGPDRAGGVTAVRPERTTTYRLVAQNEGGISTAEARLVVEGTDELPVSPDPPLQGVTLRLEYAVSYSDTTAPHLELQLTGRFLSGAGTIGRSSFAMTVRRQLPAAGGVLFPPHEENVAVSIPELRAGIWEVTAVSNLGGGPAGITCSRVQAPGATRISTLAGAQPCS